MLHGIFSATGHVTSICKIRAAPLQATSGRTECGGVWFTSGPRVHFYSTAPSMASAPYIFCYKVGPEKTRRFRDLFKEDCDSDVTVPKGQRVNTCKRTQCILEQLALQRTCKTTSSLTTYMHACRETNICTIHTETSTHSRLGKALKTAHASETAVYIGGGGPRLVRLRDYVHRTQSSARSPALGVPSLSDALGCNQMQSRVLDHLGRQLGETEVINGHQG